MPKSGSGKKARGKAQEADAAPVSPGGATLSATPSSRLTAAQANAALRARYEAARKEFADGGWVATNPRDASRLGRKLSQRYGSLVFTLAFEGNVERLRAEVKEPQRFAEGRAFITRADLEAALAGVAPRHAEVVAYASGYEAACGDIEHERKVREQERTDKEYEAYSRSPALRALGPLGFCGPFPRFGS